MGTSGTKKGERNAARNNGKKWKQHPGVSDGAYCGHTVDGYIPATLARRAAKRGAAA